MEILIEWSVTDRALSGKAEWAGGTLFWRYWKWFFRKICGDFTAFHELMPINVTPSPWAAFHARSHLPSVIIERVYIQPSNVPRMRTVARSLMNSKLSAASLNEKFQTLTSTDCILISPQTFSLPTFFSNSSAPEHDSSFCSFLFLPKKERKV